MASPIDSNGVVTREYLEKQLATSIIPPDLKNYYTKEEIVPLRNDIHHLTRKISEMSSKVFDKIVIEYDFEVENETIQLNFMYDAVISTILIRVYSRHIQKTLFKKILMFALRIKKADI